jgi:phage-related protein
MPHPSRSAAASIEIRRHGAGFGGAGLVEVVRDFRGDAFPAAYTLRYAGAAYVLPAFQKKSKTGRETARRDLELVKQRQREAEHIARRESHE